MSATDCVIITNSAIRYYLLLGENWAGEIFHDKEIGDGGEKWPQINLVSILRRRHHLHVEVEIWVQEVYWGVLSGSARIGE